MSEGHAKKSGNGNKKYQPQVNCYSYSQGEQNIEIINSADIFNDLENGQVTISVGEYEVYLDGKGNVTSSIEGRQPIKRKLPPTYRGKAPRLKAQRLAKGPTKD